MNKLSTKICALSASALMAVAFAVPASAAGSMNTQVTGANVIMVRSHRRHHGRFRMRHGHAYYHGHRGYRHHRRGYRHYNGYWFPPAAFVAGAIIGGALATPRASGSAHVRWCEAHYRSYDVRTDTFQPYHGPRRRCVSP